MKASVIIPTLNEEGRISKTIESILEKNKDVEILVCDGKSDDKTKETVKKYPVKFIDSPKRNTGFQRNYAASKASGDIIIFMDADTILYDNIIGSAIEEIKRGYKGVVFSVTFRDKNNIDKLLLPVYNFIVKISLLTKWPVMPGVCVAYEKDGFFRTGGFETETKTNEDNLLAKRIKKIGRIKLSGKRVLTSARRIRNWGYKDFIFFHLSNWLKLTRGKHPHKNYPCIEETVCF